VGESGETLSFLAGLAMERNTCKYHFVNTSLNFSHNEGRPLCILSIPHIGFSVTKVVHAQFRKYKETKKKGVKAPCSSTQAEPVDMLLLPSTAEI
jgi:hypothetical protein